MVKIKIAFDARSPESVMKAYQILMLYHQDFDKVRQIMGVDIDRKTAMQWDKRLRSRAYNLNQKTKEGRHKLSKQQEMNINKFRKLVSELEVGKKEVNVAQISEVLRVVNDILGGDLYRLIRNLPDQVSDDRPS